MKQLKLASSLVLTASIVAIALQGCNPGSTLAPIPNQEAGGDVGTGGGGGGAANTGGSGTTASTNPTTTGGYIGVATGGTPGLGTGGTPGLATGGYIGVATGGHIGVGTGGNPPSATGGNPPSATGGNPPSATGGNPPSATGGSPVTTGTGGAASNPTDCTLSASPGALTVNTDSYVADGTCGGYAFAFASIGAKAAAGSVTIAPCSDTTQPGCAGATVTKFADTTKLCATGSVGVDPGYNSTAGFGFNMNQGPTSTTAGSMAQHGTGLQISFTAGTKPAVLRAQISNGTTDFCYDISAKTSPVQIPWGQFNSACWDAAPAAANALPATAPIAKVQLIIPSDVTAVRTFSALCLTGVSTY